jgi:hypothetical protein
MLGQVKLIDCVVKEQGETDWRVVLEVHKGEWLRSTAFWMLEEKLNAYAGFILDGDMQAHYPGSTLETTHLVLASVDPLPDRAVWLMERVAAVMQEHGVKVSWNVEGGMSPDGTPPPTGFKETESGTKRD